MHGRKRAEYKAKMRNPEVAAGLQHKANQWYKLEKSLFKASGETKLELSSNLLLVNPDPLYIWSQRRELLGEHQWNAESELQLTQSCLERNPKAYGAWFHRKWVVTTSPEVDLEKELGLTTLFLTYDERNFHCWNYRRFVVGCLCGSSRDGSIELDSQHLFGAQVGSVKSHAPSSGKDDVISILQTEFHFTHEKITHNFSNGSAFHYRSKLLKVLPEIDVSDELELVHNAIFTEPDDQTAWWYLEFLLENYSDTINLEEEQELLEELVEAEENKTKWGLLGLFQVLTRTKDKTEDIVARQREVLALLQELDPDRKMRYNCMMKKL